MTIGLKIKLLRKNKGLNQNQLATSLNVTRQAVNQWEKDKSVPRLDKLKILSKELDCTLEDLVNNDITS